MLILALEMITAFAGVLSLYANALLSLQTKVFATGQGVSAIFGGVMFAGVTLLALAPRGRPQEQGAIRIAPTILLVVALGGFAVSTLGGFADRGATIQDW